GPAAECVSARACAARLLLRPPGRKSSSEVTWTRSLACDGRPFKRSPRVWTSEWVRRKMWRPHWGSLASTLGRGAGLSCVVQARPFSHLKPGPAIDPPGPTLAMHSVAYGQKVVVDEIIDHGGHGHIRRHYSGLLQGQTCRQDRFPLGSADAVV